MVAWCRFGSARLELSLRGCEVTWVRVIGMLELSWRDSLDGRSLTPVLVDKWSKEKGRDV